MRDSMSISGVPLDEPCTQVGPTDYMPMMRKEVTAFKNQLERLAEAGKFGPRGRAYFKVTSNPHDFGTYLDIDVVYDDTDEEGEAFALEVESNIPFNWDDEAKKELGDEYFESLKKGKTDE